MRGNELISKAPEMLAMLFPIPMRGNEWLEWRLQTAPGTLFPIPMRGNEWNAISVSAPWTCRFPIPMRGNES